MRVLTGREAEQALGSTFVMPTPAELDSLQTIVVARYPNLGPAHIYRNDPQFLMAPSVEGDDEEAKKWPPMRPAVGRRERREQEYAAGFAAGFRYIGTLGRTDEPSQAHMWVDRAERWFADSLGEARSLRWPSFVAAAVAHGDVTFTPLDRFPYDTWLGLSWPNTGRPAREAWRRVLAGELLVPIKLPAPRQPLPPQVRIGELPSITLRSGGGG